MIKPNTSTFSFTQNSVMMAQDFTPYPHGVRMVAFYPGSFDPVTRGHMDIIRRGLELTPHLVIGVGNNMRKKTLFTADERVSLIRQSLAEYLTPEALARVTVTAYSGATVHYAREIKARFILKGLRGAADYAYEEKMAIVNYRLAPEIDSVFLFTDNSLRDVSSSVVKEMALADVDPANLDHYLTPPVRDALLKRIGENA